MIIFHSLYWPTEKFFIVFILFFFKKNVIGMIMSLSIIEIIEVVIGWIFFFPKSSLSNDDKHFNIVFVSISWHVKSPSENTILFYIPDYIPIEVTHIIILLFNSSSYSFRIFQTWAYNDLRFFFVIHRPYANKKISFTLKGI